jgi:cytochrome b pre-mRNA-processing protein 3
MKALLRVLGLAHFDPAAEALYRAAVKEGRRELYYIDWPEKARVPDTVDGRFDMISLMAALLNRRIAIVKCAEGPQGVETAKRAQNLAQELFDVMFADMDTNLREMGVSDEGMKGKIKPMASAHLGRVKAYSECLTKDGEGSAVDDVRRLQDMADALDRNIYRTIADADPMPLARRALALAEHLDGVSDDDIMGGRVDFPEPASFPVENNGA